MSSSEEKGDGLDSSGHQATGITWSRALASTGVTKVPSKSKTWMRVAGGAWQLNL